MCLCAFAIIYLVQLKALKHLIKSLNKMSSFQMYIIGSVQTKLIEKQWW